MDLYRAYKNESPDAGCGRCEGNGFGPIHIHFSEFMQWIARGLTHHVNAGRQVHNNGRAGERISQVRIRTQIAQDGNLTQSRDRPLQIWPRSEIPDSSNRKEPRCDEVAANASSHESVRARHQYSFIHAGSSGNVLFIAAIQPAPMGELVSVYIPCFQTQSVHHSSHSNGLVVTLDEGLASVMSLFPDLFRMLKEVHEQ